MNEQDYLSASRRALRGRWPFIFLLDALVAALFIVHVYRQNRDWSYYRLDFSVPYTERGEIPAIDAGAPFGPVKVFAGSQEVFDELGLLVRAPKSETVESIESTVGRFVDDYYASRPAVPSDKLASDMKEIGERSDLARRELLFLAMSKGAHPGFGPDSYSDLKRDVVDQEWKVWDMRNEVDGMRQKSAAKPKFLDIKTVPLDKKMAVELVLKTILVVFLASLAAMVGVVAFAG